MPEFKFFSSPVSVQPRQKVIIWGWLVWRTMWNLSFLSSVWMTECFTSGLIKFIINRYQSMLSIWYIRNSSIRLLHSFLPNLSISLVIMLWAWEGGQYWFASITSSILIHFCSLWNVLRSPIITNLLLSFVFLSEFPGLQGWFFYAQN